MNWIASGVDTLTNKSFEYQINVCRSLVPFANSLGTQCEGAGACQTSLTNASYYVSLGQIRSPRILSGSPFLFYSTPSTVAVTNCPNGLSPRSKITFVCKPGYIGNPVYQKTTTDCVYLFLWETSAACSSTIISGSNCQVRDPTSGLWFDMTPLASTDYTFSSSTGAQYTLHVCGAASNTTCGANAGGCVQNGGNTQSLGMPSSSPLFSDFSLTLALAGGSSCNGGAGTRSTNIQFACNPSAGIGAPVFVSDDGCLVNVRWETSSACTSRQQIPCVYVDPSTGITYDLTTLAESANNFYTNNGTTLYAVAVCHAVVPEALASNCNPAAGICEVNGTLAQSFNFGSVASLKTINGVLVAQYTNGDLCGPSNTPSSANITFTCDPNVPTGLSWIAFLSSSLFFADLMLISSLIYCNC